jgi:hypothetical protein
LASFRKDRCPLLLGPKGPEERPLALKADVVKVFERFKVEYGAVEDLVDPTLGNTNDEDC